MTYPAPAAEQPRDDTTQKTSHPDAVLTLDVALDSEFPVVNAVVLLLWPDHFLM